MSHEKITDAIERLIAILGPADWRVGRYHGDVAPDRIVSLLADVITDTGVEMRATNTALWLSHHFSSPSLAAALIDVVRNRPEIACGAGNILGTKATDEHVPELETILLSRTLPPASRAGAARALGGLGGSRVSNALKRALVLPGQDVGVLDDTIQALAWSQIRSDTKDAVEDIAVFLKSDVPDIRYSALVALGNLGAQETIEAITTLLNDVGTSSRGKSLKEEAVRVIRLLKDWPGPGSVDT